NLHIFVKAVKSCRGELRSAVAARVKTRANRKTRAAQTKDLVTVRGRSRSILCTPRIARRSAKVHPRSAQPSRNSPRRMRHHHITAQTPHCLARKVSRCCLAAIFHLQAPRTHRDSGLPVQAHSPEIAECPRAEVCPPRLFSDHGAHSAPQQVRRTRQQHFREGFHWPRIHPALPNERRDRTAPPDRLDRECRPGTERSF